MFSATSVAVVGASPKQTNVGRGVVENLRSLSPQCRVAAVGPAADGIAGVESAASLRELCFTPEAVVIAVGAERVPAVVQDAAELGVRGAVVFAGGFAEAGAEGHALQDQIRAVAERHEMAIIGPNCQGLVNFVRPLPLYSDQIGPYEAGNVALVSQSGSVTTSLINNRRGVRWSHAVSSGNEAGVDAADLLKYFLHAPEVKVVCAFLEAIRRPERFFELCSLAREAGKAVVICKTGRTNAAQRAAAAHSGALGTPDRLIDALMRRHGVIRTESLSELLETVKAVASGVRPKRPRIGVLSGSGGHIELLLDEAERAGLEIPSLTEDTCDRLRAVTNGAVSAINPFDYYGIPNLDEVLPRALEIIASDPNADVLLGLVDFSHGPTGRRPRARRLLQAWDRASKREEQMLVLLDAIGGTPPQEAIEQASGSHVLVLSELRTGLRALAHLVALSAPVPRSPAPQPIPGLYGLASTFSQLQPGINSGELALRLVRAAGIPVVPTTVLSKRDPFDAHTVDMGFPVVAKAADPTLAHKAGHGGVALGIRSADELARAVARLREIGDGSVMIQPQLTAEIELLAGITSAPELGSFIVLGVGGILTEGMDDVAIRPVGLSDGDAESLLTELRAYPALRAHPSFTSSLTVIVDVISRLDQLAQVLGSPVESLDINPLMVIPEGCMAVDALLVVR
jgi:acyl-CoA synthetase (NDP forming)